MFFSTSSGAALSYCGAPPPVSRFDRIPERVRAVLVYAFGQKKFVRRNPGAERSAGWMHFFIFWGFCILGIQILTMFGRGYSDSFVVPGFSLNLLGGPYLLLRDIHGGGGPDCGWGCVCAMGDHHAPRLYGFLPPESRLRDKSHWEAYTILLFIATVMVTGLVYDGGRIVADPNNMQSVREARWAPLRLGAAIGMAKPSARASPLREQRSWWVHNLVILVFFNFLPPAKHFHIITASRTSFSRNSSPRGSSPSRTSRMTTRFGTSHIDQFTWKQVLDMFSCTECGRCSSNCPATATRKPLAPRQLLLDLRDYLYRTRTRSSKARTPPGQRAMARNPPRWAKTSSAR